MARTYLFFRPARLPLASDELSEQTVLPLADDAVLRAALERALPGLQWVAARAAAVDVGGAHYELSLPETPEATLALRGSLRIDHAALVQRLCDEFGWLAFDDRPMCFQPHRAPMPA